MFSIVTDNGEMLTPQMWKLQISLACTMTDLCAEKLSRTEDVCKDCHETKRRYSKRFLCLTRARAHAVSVTPWRVFDQ